LASAFDVFRRAERIETVAAAVYALLAQRFRDDGEASGLFSRLEQEELQHARRVRLLASAYQHDSKLLGQINGASELEACLAEAERALGELQAGGWGPDLGDVLSRVAALEDRLASAHANLLAMNADGALRAFFEQLALMDAGHAELLRR
jgi:rubrerythrin